MLRFAAVLLALVALGGCSRGPLVRDAPDAGPARGFPDHSVAQIVAAVGSSVGRVQSVAADGKIEIVQDGRSQDATFSLRARLTGRPSDSVTVVVRGPLGIEGARGVATADSFFAADRLHRRLYVGRVDAVERYVAGGGSPEQLARTVLGLLVPDPAEAWTVTPTETHYVLRAPLSGGGRREVTVDPALWRVVRVRDLAPGGTVRAAQEVSDFDRVDGVVVPRRVRVVGGGIEARLEHRTIALNPSDLRLRFRRPDDYETIRLP